MEEVQYPLFYPCVNSKEWESLNDQASEMLGYADENAQTYSMPIVDKNGVHHFIVNQEVAKLVDLKKCIGFDKIEFNNEI